MGMIFVLLGIFVFVSKKEKAFGFWANAKMFPVTDVKAYNRALGKLWCVYGIVLILLGIPLLEGQNALGVVITILGTMAESIAAMAYYTIVIDKKYRKQG